MTEHTEGWSSGLTGQEEQHTSSAQCLIPNIVSKYNHTFLVGFKENIVLTLTYAVVKCLAIENVFAQIHNNIKLMAA